MCYNNMPDDLHRRREEKGPICAAKVTGSCWLGYVNWAFAYLAMLQ